MYKYYIEVDGEPVGSCSTYQEAGDSYRAVKKQLLPGQFIALVGRDLDLPLDVPTYYRHDWRNNRPDDAGAWMM